MKKQKLIKELKEFVEFEEEITFDLTSNYLKKIKNSELTDKQKEEIQKRLKTLLRETGEHYQKFTELIKEVENSEKEDF